MSDELLVRFIAAVEALRTDPAHDPEARLAIARELGLTDEDLARARDEGERHLTRGDGFLRNRLWEEAVRELDKADALLPDNLRVLTALALAHQGRFRHAGDAKDRARAHAIASHCLQLDPRHEPSFALLRALDAPAPRKALGTGVIAAAVCTVLAVAVAASVVVLRRGSVSTSALCGPRSRYCTVLTQARYPEGKLDIGLEPAQLDVSPSAVRFSVAGRITHHGATELELLRFTLRFLDASGSEVGRKPFEVVHTFQPPLRAGDSTPFHFGEVVPASTRSAELLTEEVRTRPAPTSYGESPTIPLAFAPMPPSHVHLEARARTRDQKELGAKTSLEGIAEIINRGEGVIRGLEIEVAALDETGVRKGRADRITVAYTHMAPMQPGERRVVKFHLWVESPIAEARFTVVKVE